MQTRTFNIQEYRSYPDGIHTLFSAAYSVGSGLVMTKDYALLAAFEVTGEDPANMTPEHQNYVAERVQSALTMNIKGGGWVTYHEFIRKPCASYPDADQSHFSDPISSAIDHERRNAFEEYGRHYESVNILAIRYKPQFLEHPWFQSLLYTGKQERTISTLVKDIEQFERALQSLTDSLTGVITLRRLEEYEHIDPKGNVILRDDLLNYLNQAMTCEPYPINKPTQPMALEEYMGGRDFFPGDILRVGFQHIAAISLYVNHPVTYPNMLEALNHIPLSYRFVTKFAKLDQHESVGVINQRGKEWEQQEKSALHQVFKLKSNKQNLHAVNMHMDTQLAAAEAQSGQVEFGYCTQTLILYGENPQEVLENARYMVQEINRMGLNCVLETLNSVEAWLGTIPGNIHQNVRRQLTHTGHLANMIPLTTVWSGHHQCPNPLMPNMPPLMYTATTGSTPFRLNLHVSDVGHTLIMGPTGAGKSVLLGTIAAQFKRYPKATICAFDKGRSLWALVNACGGQHYDIGSDQETLSFAPLTQIDSETEMAWAEDWIATLYSLMTGKTVSPRQQEEIHRAMRLLRETKAPNQRSLTDFLITLQRVNDTDDLKTALSHYTHDGAYGKLLDAREDTFTDSTFSVFEIEELMAMKEKIAIPVLLYLFRRFERTLQGQPALLLLDEAWVMLGHPVFREKIRQWLKELRKKNCAVVMATQSLSDAIQSRIYDVLIESCPTKILLPNEEADKVGTSEFPGPRDLYAMMGLNDTEIETLRRATKKRDYYYVSLEGRRLFELGLGPVALSFVAVSDKKTLAYLRQLKAHHGAQWPYVWLQERRVHVPTAIEV